MFLLMMKWANMVFIKIKEIQVKSRKTLLSVRIIHNESSSHWNAQAMTFKQMPNEGQISILLMLAVKGIKGGGKCNEK